MKALSRGFRSLSSTAIATLVVCLVLLSLPQTIVAQTIAGSITGTLVDPTGAVVPNVTVTALNQDQRTTAQVKTDAGGRFVFPIVLPGNYTISAAAAGFKKIEKSNIVLNANTALALGNLQLELGSSAEMVRVEAQGIQIQTENAQRGDTIVGAQLENVQVNGQSPMTLLRLLPGVISPTNQAESGQQFGSIYVNGARSGMAHVTVNGGTNEDTGANSGWMAPLSLDAVQEVNVLTSSYQAQYGRSGGAQIDLVTKSGTSVFHGSGFEYYRDKGMNANTWTNNRVGLPVGAYHYNDFGFTFGGPIYIPGKFGSSSLLLLLVDHR